MLLYLFVVTVVYIAFLIACCEYKIKQLRTLGVGFQYGITDFWGAIIGLTPTFLFITYLIHRGTADFLPLAALALWVLSQCAGMIFLRADYAVSCARTHEIESGLSSATYVFLGSTVGATVLLTILLLGNLALCLLLSL